MRIRLALIAALCVPTLAPGAALADARLVAQVETRAAARQVQVLVDRAMAALAAGGDDPGAVALTFTNTANIMAIAHPDLPVTISYLPNLVAARAYGLRHEWANMEQFAGAVLRALDGPDTTTHPMRVQAATLLAHAMVRQGRASDAALTLAPVMQIIADAPRSDTTDLARFWYGTALTQIRGAGWSAAAAQSFALRDSPLLRPHDLAAFIDDYLFTLREEGAPPETIAAVADVSARTAILPGVHPIDRAVFLGRVVTVLAENGEAEAAIKICQDELAQLGPDYRGSMARNALGMQLIRLWFQTDRIDQGLAFSDILLAESTGLDAPNWMDIHLLYVLRGAAFNHLGQNAQAQEAWRRAYAAVRQYERATSFQAQSLAAEIDQADPGFAAFEYAGELADASGIRTDGPADAVLLRFLQGNYAQSELAFLTDPLTADTGDMDAVERNKALHLALSGQDAAAQTAISDILMYLDDAAATPEIAAARDEMLLFRALGAFWWQGDGARDNPDLFADLPRLTASLPADRANFTRALMVAALHNDGRMPAAVQALADWQAAIDPARTTHSAWDVAAAMVAVEMAYAQADTDLAARIAAQTAPWADGLPPLGLQQDYLALVRLLNAPVDLETDKGLVDLGAIVQRLGAQVPQGHLLRASSRFGLARALWARERLPQAREMMAAAARALRENPNHAVDVMAFLQSSEAQILAQMGEHDRALNLARAAFDAMPPDTRTDYRVGIVTTLAWELVQANRHLDAAELVEAQLGAPGFLDDMAPDLMVETLRARASLQDVIRNAAFAAGLLDRAEAIAATRPVGPVQRIGLLWDRGIQLRNAGRYEPALRKLAAANDGYFAMRADVAAGSASGQALSLGQDADRVLGELTVAWSLYRERTAP